VNKDMLHLELMLGEMMDHSRHKAKITWLTAILGVTRAVNASGAGSPGLSWIRAAE